MVTAKTRRELTDRMRAAQRSAEQGARSARADLTLARYLTHWIDNVVPGTVSDATEAQYRNVLRLYVIPRLGTKRLATLSPSDVDAMLRDMSKPTEKRPDGYSPTSRRLARSILRLALRRAEADGLIARNAAALSNSVRQDRTEGRSLTPDQARWLLAAASGDRFEAGIVIALMCGLRLSELLGLTWDSIDLESNPPRLAVRRSLKESPVEASCSPTPRRIGAAASSISPKRPATRCELTGLARLSSAPKPAIDGITDPSAPTWCSGTEMVQQSIPPHCRAHSLMRLTQQVSGTGHPTSSGTALHHSSWPQGYRSSKSPTSSDTAQRPSPPLSTPTCSKTPERQYPPP